MFSYIKEISNKGFNMKAKNLFIILFLLVLTTSIFADDNITIARRMKIVIANLQNTNSDAIYLKGSVLADKIEQFALENSKFIDKVIILQRKTLPSSKLQNFSPEQIMDTVKKGQDIGVEGVLIGNVIQESNKSTYTIQLQLIDVQKKNVPTSRRVINFAEVRGVQDSLDALSVNAKKLVNILSQGQFPRVDIITPNFDVVSILQINKDKFPEIKLSVSVVNNKGEPVTISPDVFEVRENGNMVLANVEKVKSSEKTYTPITILLVIDRSPSMLEELDGTKTGKPFQRAKDAALEFISKLSPKDKVKILAFDYNALALGDYTTDKEYYKNKLQNLKTGRGTGLYNILKYAVQDIANIKGEKAVILLTDGKNDVRRASEEIKKVTLDEGIEIAKKNTIPVYTIGFSSADKSVLGKIAKETHSIFFQAASSEKLRELYLKLHNIIENQYIVTYKSLADKYGKVNVSLNVKEDERAFQLNTNEQQKATEYKTQKSVAQEKKDVALQKQEITILEKKVEAQKTELAKKEAELLEKETTLTNGLKKLQALKEKLNTKEKILSDKELEIQRKEAELKAQQEKIKEIKSNIQKTGQEISDYLKQKLKYLNDEQKRLDQLQNKTGSAP